MSLLSFKPEYRQTPLRGSTPPPPAYEPLSPILNPADGSDRHARRGADQQPPALEEAAPKSTYTQAARYSYDEPLRSAPLPRQRPQHSPLEAPAHVAATSPQASPVYVNSSRRSSYIPTSPTTVYYPPGGHGLKHTYPYEGSYTHDGRPAKRARSEFFSPQHGQNHARPATSHIPWSYNVEQMVDNGTRMYQEDGAPPGQYQDDSLKRLSDAQLLMDFAFGASHSVSPSASAAPRHSISLSQVPDPRHAQNYEPSSPHAGAPQSTYRHPQHAHPLTGSAQMPDGYSHLPDAKLAASAVQTHTPPEDSSNGALAPPTHEANHGGEPKPKKNQGWPKGKPRGPRAGASGSKKKKSTPKPKVTQPSAAPEAPDQLQSPQSLPAEQQEPTQIEDTISGPEQIPLSREPVSQTRRHSFSLSAPPSLQNNHMSIALPRARSVPPATSIAITPPADDMRQAVDNPKNITNQDPVCAGCHSTESAATIGDGEQWISCDGCKEWYHFVCAGFNSEREVRDVDKFYCVSCQPHFGKTTKVRKSARAHTAVDYAGLNEGILKTSDDNPEHHYIAAFKNGDIEFDPETFARMPPEIITADYLEKTNGFKEPILIPAILNPRPKFPGRKYPDGHASDIHAGEQPSKLDEQPFEYDMVPDDGQDKLDMVIPEGLTVRRVAELYGTSEPVPVIDVKAQEGEDKKWTMGKWADYYEQQGEKVVRNVISLEVSRSRLGRLIRRPKAVRDMDLQDSVWEENDKMTPPPVQFYCLMSVADCYTDFHIDFGGSSVYYHIVKGKKVFFFIPPSKQNLKKYEDWCLSPKQGHEFLGKQVKECYRVDLYPGDTMLIPSGWIHAVWTPEDSLVIGGNFLTRIHYGMQIRVLEIEKNTKVAPKFRYPYFQKIMWLSLIKYLEEDPLPSAVEQLLLSGNQFKRSIPIYCEPDKFGHNSHLGLQNYNRRYYSKAELESLTDLANYIWRTVLISIGKIEVAQTTKNAVTRSIPKGHGEPLVLARKFAMWIAWKRGNENIPQWAYPDAAIPETADSEKKLSAAQVKRMERESWSDSMRERQSTRIRGSDPSPDSVDNFSHDPSTSTQTQAQPLTGFLRPPADPARHMTTPKTSQLGPKRIACDACRKRRIRCKHKDELVETNKTGMHSGMSTLDLSGSLGLSVKRRLSEPYGTQQHTPIVNGGPISADLNTDPYALKSGRVKACADCRKSKRRCIHDEYGNVDPIKANEVPIPRGSAGKKRRISEGQDEPGSAKKMKQEPIVDSGMVNGDVQPLHSVSNSLDIGSSSTQLQDIAFSAQQALGQASFEDLVPVDPALQHYNNGHVDAMDIDPAASELPDQDIAVSSIENLLDGPRPMPIEGTVELEIEARSEPQGPSVEPLTPAPIFHGEPKMNGTKSGSTSPMQTTFLEHNNITVSLPPPLTPTATVLPRSRGSTSCRKASQTPRPSHAQTPSRPSNRKSHTPKSTPGGSGRRRDSKESIKIEQKPGETPEEIASLQLALQLQMEEHGLRRRSK